MKIFYGIKFLTWCAICGVRMDVNVHAHSSTPLPTRFARGASRKRTLLLKFRVIRPIRVTCARKGIRVEKIRAFGESRCGNYDSSLAFISSNLSSIPSRSDHFETSSRSTS